MKLFRHFKVIDEKIFGFISDLKSNEQYIQFNQRILSLDDSLQNLIKNSIFIVILFLPILVLILVYTSISSQQDFISLKRQFLHLSETHQSLEKSIQSFNNGLIASNPINTEDDIKTMISSNPLVSNILPRLGFENFNQSPLSGNIKESNLQIKFSEFSTIDLSSFIKFTYQSLKSRVTFVSITRDEQSKKIFGELSLTIISN